MRTLEAHGRLYRPCRWLRMKGPFEYSAEEMAWPVGFGWPRESHRRQGRERSLSPVTGDGALGGSQPGRQSFAAMRRSNRELGVGAMIFTVPLVGAASS